MTVLTSVRNASLNFISKALAAFAMQMYYEDTGNATNPNKQLFTDTTGGIQFDIGDVSKDIKANYDAKRLMPPGACTSAASPSSLPIRAWAIGELMCTRPSLISASSSPTIL